MNSSKSIFTFFLLFNLLGSSPLLVLGQSDTVGSRELFSAQMFPSKTTSRGAAPRPEDLEAFSKGSIRLFDFQNQYKKVFLGSDFFEAVVEEKACDSLKMRVGKLKTHFIPVSDGLSFDHTKHSRIEELEGYYKFKNSKNLPAVLPNVDVWIRIQAYRHGQTANKNCLVIKFLIPENVAGSIVNKVYAMRNDGVLVLLTEGNEPDFSLRKDFFDYCILPLNDPKETTHLVGKDFSVMGSFACQKQCHNMHGLLFPISRHGNSSGCIFFRRIGAEMAPGF